MKNFKAVLLQKLFTLSNQPVLLKDLLDVNSQACEGFIADPARLHYRLNTGRSYAIYAIFCAAILIPCTLLSHAVLTKLDFHVSIIITILLTCVILIGYDYFKKWAMRAISKKLIMRAWVLHFPYFNYDEYSQTISDIYTDSLRENIPKTKLEEYILGKLVHKKEN